MKSLNQAGWAIALLAIGLGLASCADTGPSAPQATARAPVAAKPASGQKVRPDFPGFRRVVRQDTEYFCQVRTPTGSRARTGEQCFRRDEMEAMEANNREFFKDAGGGSSHDSLKMDSPR